VAAIPLLPSTGRLIGHFRDRAGYALRRTDDPRRDSGDFSPLLRHCAVAVFIRDLGTTQQHLRRVAAIERNRLPSEILKRLFAPLHLASLTRVLSACPLPRDFHPD
jgi:hypothetical protein